MIYFLLVLFFYWKNVKLCQKLKGVLFGKISNLKNEVKLESMKTQTEFNFISIVQISTVLCTPKRTKCSFPFYFSYLLVHSFRCCRMMGGAYDLKFSSNERMNLRFSLSSENFKTVYLARIAETQHSKTLVAFIYLMKNPSTKNKL